MKARTILLIPLVIWGAGSALGVLALGAESKQGSSVKRPSSQEAAILNNLRSLSIALDRFFLEHLVKTAKYSQLVGPGKYVSKLVPLDGEDYTKLDLTVSTKTWTIVTKGGLTVTYQR